MDTYAMVTNRIIEMMEKDDLPPWHKPWTGISGAISHVSGKRYSLINQLLLGGQAGEYLTFNQVRMERGRIRKGEKGKQIVFWKMIEKKDEEKRNEQEKLVPLLRYYTVFRIDQCEGIKPRYNSSIDANKGHLSHDKRAEEIIYRYIKQSGVRLNIGLETRAYYSPLLDTITIPHIRQYSEAAEYYSTAFHEIVHSTGVPSRLNRFEINTFTGSQDYSKEELVAELGSAFLCNSLGVETKGSVTNSTAYIKGWLTVLRNDKRMIVSAAAKAEQAVSYVLGKNAEIEQAA